MPDPTWPPTKPYKSFPLTPHRRGWVKKLSGAPRHICGKLPWQEALAFWEANATAIRAKWAKVAAGEAKAGKAKPPDEVTVGEVASYWLRCQREQLDAGSLTASYYGECREVIALALEHLGEVAVAADVGPSDFARYRAAVFLAKKGERERRLKLTLVKTMFRAAADDEVIDRVPAFGRRFLADLAPPDARLTGRRGREKTFSRVEIWKLLTVADAQVKAAEGGGRNGAMLRRAHDSAIQIRAMVWLAMNGGYHAKELAELPVVALHLDDGEHGRVDEWRGKTKSDHLVPLWPETRAAIDVVLERHRKSRPADVLLFRTAGGVPWVRDELVLDEDGEPKGGSKQSATAQAFKKLKDLAEIDAPGKGIHGVRHTHRSAAGGAGDLAAAKTLIGHRVGGIDGVYDHVSWERLEAVAAHVRRWLGRP